MHETVGTVGACRLRWILRKSTCLAAHASLEDTGESRSILALLPNGLAFQANTVLLLAFAQWMQVTISASSAWVRFVDARWIDGWLRGQWPISGGAVISISGRHAESVISGEHQTIIAPLSESATAHAQQVVVVARAQSHTLTVASTVARACIAIVKAEIWAIMMMPVWMVMTTI